MLWATLAEDGPLVYFCYRLADSQVLYVSPNYEHELGGHVATVNEEVPNWLAQLHPDDRGYLSKSIRSLLEDRQTCELRLRILRADGGIRWLCLTATALPLAAGSTDRLIGGYVKDISATQNIVEMANAYQAKKNSMLEILSHDLAAPLVLAEQLSEYIAERVEILNDQEINRMLGRLRQNCQEGVTLIRDFVDHEFMESANVDLHLERIDLANRLGVLLGSYREREHATGHRFYYQSSHPSIFAYLDENKFLQAVNNLLGNAMKFTPDNGQITVNLSQHPQHLLLTVADNGIRIPAGLQSVLFERFTRARRPGLRGEKTTGLGMSIIQSIVQLHQGRIWFESQEGQGSTFYIELPRPDIV